MANPITYEKSGVDPKKAASILSSFASYLSTRPKDPRLLSGIGPFASCYSLKELLTACCDPVLVTCCDGVGTKLKLALEWGDLKGLGQDLVAMNVNDLLCAGANPFLFLDYYACGKLMESQLSEILKSIQKGCEIASCTLAGGETAELPGLYKESDFDLAGFAVGIADRKSLLSPSLVRVGDELVAIESSGFHSNGYSLVRKLVDKTGIQPSDIPSFSKSKTWKEILLRPTHIYVSAMKNIVSSNCLHGLAHITGGGLYENLPRILPDGVTALIDSSSWEIPPLFCWAQEKAEISTENLLSTFNCGIGMIAICAAEKTNSVIEEIRKASLKAWKIGTIEQAQVGESKITWQLP